MVKQHKMWFAIALFELKLGIARVSNWIYLFTLFLLAFLIVNLMGGAFDGANIVVGGNNTNINSPLTIASIQIIIGIISSLICAAIFGNAAYKDFENNSFPLFFTKPISPTEYYFGRYIGAFIQMVIIQLGVSLGLFLGFLMPYLEQDVIGPFRLEAFLQPFIIFIIPNIFLVGSVLFSLAITTRRMLPTYLASVILLFAYVTSSSFTGEIETRWIAAIIDPFGFGALEEIIRYWTPFEQNNNIIPINNLVILNRATWFLVGFICLLAGFIRFDFMQIIKQKSKNIIKDTTLPKIKDFQSIKHIQNFDFFSNIIQLLVNIKIEVKRAFSDPYFIGILATLAGFLFLNQQGIGMMYGVKTLPVTQQVVSVLGSTLSLFMLIIITFYSGQIIWREREIKVDQIMDSLPVNSFVPILSKLITLIIMPAIMLFILIIVGIVIQSWRGFYDYEIHLYLKQFFLLNWTKYIMLCMLAFFIQILVFHKYLGHFILVLYFLFNSFAGSLGLNHNLYRFNSGQGSVYSDMNGYHPYINKIIVFKLYWFSFSVILILIAYLFWNRGSKETFRLRLKEAKKRFRNKYLKYSFSLSIVTFLIFGVYIFYNTNILNTYHLPKYYERQSAEYEKKYKKYENIASLKITDVVANVELYPSEGRLEYSGTYVLKNKTTVKIDTVHSNFSVNFPFSNFNWNAQNSLASSDSIYGWNKYVFNDPVNPGEEIKLNFSGEWYGEGFMNAGVHKKVIKNGTMIWSGELFPSFGYSSSGELSTSRKRKKYNLPKQKGMLKYNDIDGKKHNIIGDNADWVTFEIIIGTEKDQIAMAPGSLQSKWIENNRKYFQYRVSQPILNLFAIISGKYEVFKDTSEGVDLEIYYHKSHDYVLSSLMEGMKKSLKYYSGIYGPYPYKHCRIIEFPYGSYAASFPNTIPFSEKIGFILDVDDNDPEDLDLPFWVTAHEMGHQWWPHQLVGGNVQGSVFLSESLSEYSAVSLLAQEKGETQLRKFLEYELDKYLFGRAVESRFEPPIIETEGQQYILYNKAGLVMYTLSDFIGKDKFNSALGEFIESKRYSSAPYPNIGDLIKKIREYTPEDLQYLITDTFEKITIYENKAKEATAIKKDNGNYLVTFTVEAQKFYSDSLGFQSKSIINDWLEIGILGDTLINNNNVLVPIYLEKVLFSDSLKTFDIEVSKKPIKAGIDPIYKFIDRDKDDNLISVDIKK